LKINQHSQDEDQLPQSADPDQLIVNPLDVHTENECETAANTSTAATTTDNDSTTDETTSDATSSDTSDQEDNDNDDDDLNNATAGSKKSPISQGSPISIGPFTPTANTLDQLANNKTLISLEKLEEQVKQKVHNRKFREYCNQIVNREIDEVCSLLLHEIVRFQDRMYHKNPIKAKARRRYVMGIREVS